MLLDTIMTSRTYVLGRRGREGAVCPCASLISVAAAAAAVIVIVIVIIIGDSLVLVLVVLVVLQQKHI